MNVEIDLNVTEKAIEQFKKAMKDANLENSSILVSATTSCSGGTNYVLDFLDKTSDNHIVENYDGVNFAFEKKTLLSMDGITINWHEEEGRQGFKFESNDLNSCSTQKTCCSKKGGCCA